MINFKKAHSVATRKAIISTIPPFFNSPVVYADVLADELEKQLIENNNEELLKDLFDKYDDSEKFKNDIKKLFNNPDWIFLYKKITNIINKKRNVDGYIKLLSNILWQALENNNYTKFYDETWFIIDLIEKLSADSLLFLFKIKELSSKELNLTMIHHLNISHNNNNFICDNELVWIIKHYDWRILILNYLISVYWFNNELCENLKKEVNLNYLILLIEELYDNWIINVWATDNIVNKFEFTFSWKKIFELLWK